MENFFTRFFPQLKIYHSKTNLRFTKHTNEVMHFDRMRSEGMLLRVMLNLDALPRVWANSYTLHELVCSENPHIRKQYKAGHDCIGMVNYMNRFYRSESNQSIRCNDLFPRRNIHLNPGALLMGHPVLGSHTVIFGRRALNIDWMVRNIKDPVVAMKCGLSMKSTRRAGAAIIHSEVTERRGMSPAPGLRAGLR